MLNKTAILCVFLLISSSLCAMSSTDSGSSRNHDAQEQCPICLGRLNYSLPVNDDYAVIGESIIFGCSHKAHASCLAEWIRTNGQTYGIPHTTCPLCRACIKLPLPSSVHHLIGQALFKTSGEQFITFNPELLLQSAAAHDDIIHMQRAIELGATVEIHTLQIALEHESFVAADWLLGHGIKQSDDLLGLMLERVLCNKNFNAACWTLTRIPETSKNIFLEMALRNTLHIKNFEASQWIFDHGILGGLSLRTALFEKDFDAAQWLVDRGVDVGQDGGMLLKSAIDDEKFDTAEWLVSHGADVNIDDGHQLKHALSDKHFKNASWLIEHGADFSTALQRAIDSNDHDTIEFLYARSPWYTRATRHWMAITAGVTIAYIGTAIWYESHKHKTKK